ncbi:phytanoyl-CoA dioxygenase family protein [Streptomyces sp. NA02950]|uniref:phytanoyl-CoA dioxygenase family protein n=1 Tax=Streptomyces sp. NA02950 TaxID=2742137 RepID=UPI0015913BE6|nr:phytanoyl-CoA dioxygenase family protein [Streptomyces sp. NA02950]QKV94601.1 phytanoyl-CoA dioxygenase family protein [Streptomyces sp. NA02950]
MKHHPGTVAGRALTGEESKALDQDGVICLRGALDAVWVQRVRDALDQAAADPTWIGRYISRRKEGLYHDHFVWLKNRVIRELWFRSPLADIAAQAMGSRRVNLFYDEVFCKFPGSTLPTPWHQDAAAWPVSGEHIINVWVTADRVTKENGALEFVRGSHRWGKKYRVETAEYNANLLAADLDWCPDVEANRDEYDIIRWDMEPGDVLVFGPKIVHGAGGASLTRGRRAVALRFTGDDARYDPRPHTMPLLRKHGLSKGDPMGGPLFPEILPDPPADISSVKVPHDVGALLGTFREQAAMEVLRALNPRRFQRTQGRDG